MGMAFSLKKTFQKKSIVKIFALLPTKQVISCNHMTSRRKYLYVYPYPKVAAIIPTTPVPNKLE
jgi:hypothetical protein